MDPNKLNIPSNITDPNYRYKMPKLIVATQGAGNGIKTKLENIVDVAKALKIPPDYILAFYKFELNTQADVKNNTYLVSGSHQVEQLQKLLDKLIKNFLLCTNCKLPETKMYVKKDKPEIKTKCEACGKVGKIDDKEKLTSHIKKNPPKYEDKPDVKQKPDEVDPAKITKEIMKKIKDTIKSLNEKLAGLEKPEDIIPICESIFKDNSTEVDSKYLILINILFDKTIYGVFRSKGPVIAHFISKEAQEEEAMYHFTIALIDFIYNKCKAEPLSKYVSSLVYIAYDLDIITEEFFTKYALTNMRYMPQKQSLFLNSENEEKFLNDCNDFKYWLRTAPFEDEEDHRGKEHETVASVDASATAKPELEKKVEKVVLDEEDIDDI